MERFFSCFSIVPDPRAANAQHDLMEILFIALMAVLCGAKNLATLRRLALNILRAEKSKVSIRGKIKQAGVWKAVWPSYESTRHADALPDASARRA